MTSNKAFIPPASGKLGVLLPGMGAVAIVLAIMRGTMKHMDYFIRKEHFDALGRLMMIVSFAYAYFFFNDYIVQWYGGDAATDNLLHWLEAGPMAWMFFQMVGFNIVLGYLGQLAFAFSSSFAGAVAAAGAGPGCVPRAIPGSIAERLSTPRGSVRYS